MAYFQHSIFKDMCALADIAILCITKRSGYSWTKKKKRRGQSFCPDMFMRADVQFAQREEDLTTHTQYATSQIQEKRIQLEANLEVGHTQYATSQVLQVRFQPD